MTAPRTRKPKRRNHHAAHPGVGQGKGGGMPPVIDVASREYIELGAQVAALAANGFSTKRICARISLLKSWTDRHDKPLSEGTLRRYFGREITEGVRHVTEECGAGLAQDALRGKARERIFWLATHGGPEWRQQRSVEVSGPGGGAIRVNTIEDLFVDEPDDKPSQSTDPADDAGGVQGPLPE